MKKSKTIITCKDVKEIMQVSESKAYQIIKQLNDELKANGYITIAGKVPAKYFYERTKY